MRANAALKSSLNDALCETYALLIVTHEAHFNIVGDDFFQLHAAFGSQYEALLEAADEIGERIRAIGGQAKLVEGLFECLSKSPEEKEMSALAQTVLDANQSCLTTIEKTLDLATAGKDLATQNLMIERQTWHEKTIWMLESFLTGKD